MKSKNEKKKERGRRKEENIRKKWFNTLLVFIYRVGYDINGTVFWPKKNALRKWSIC